MIERYIEKDLARQLSIINLLWETECLTSKDLANVLHVTGTTIKSDIKTINNMYSFEEQGKVISSSLLGYSILEKEQRNKKIYLHAIYEESLFLRACGYHLINNFEETDRFAQQEYISESKAYELRSEVIEFLADLGIDTTQSDPSSREVRIRFLIAYFQISYGLELVPISKYSRYNFTHLFEECQELQDGVFSDEAKRYAFLLFQLHFNRNKKFPIHFKGNWLTVIEQSQAYQTFGSSISAFLTKELHKKSQKEEVLYFSLVFSLLDRNFNDRSTKLIHYHTCVSLIKDTPFLALRQLHEIFDTHFQSKLSNHLIFELSATKFLRTCIFNLQALIPTEQSLNGQNMDVPTNFFYQVKQIINRWNRENELGLLFSDEHIRLFAFNLMSLLNGGLKSTLYIKTNAYIDYLLLKERVLQEFGRVVNILPFNSKELPANYTKNDVILFEEMDDTLEKIICKKIKISKLFDFVYTNKLQSHLFSYDSLQEEMAS